MSILSRTRRLGRFGVMTAALALALGAGVALSLQARAADLDTPSTATPPPAPAAPSPSGGWLDVSTWPLIPVPEIGVDPDSGVTLGVLPVWLRTNDQHEITRIFAPDLIYNPNFGVGGHFRIFEYPSLDEQWSVVAGSMERVEREFDYEFQKGRLRDSHWSFDSSLIFDRSGVPRFYGIGNHTLAGDVTNYTASQLLGQGQVGYNLNHTWQIQYTLRARRMEITPGTLSHVPTIETRYPDVHGLGVTNEVLNQVALVYDTRDDSTIPTRGTQWVAYAGVNGHDATISDSIYSLAGLDARTFVPLSFLPDTVLAAHAALRYLPSGHEIPFFDLSSIGGGESDIGGEQLLRGFGQGRFVDRDSFDATFEFRHRAFSFDAAASHVDIEVAPFIDMGEVSSHTGTDPLSGLHKVFGVGVRGIARPSVVGYVDIGYGTEGVAVFTGINYPF
ncbi:MAG TPA: BamA/TamA family outer membrane protein [Steroidobacteraceae bacterium]|nr:BamA/TamA family outer membrane protein [Steroidobacteraceae bacterium]